MSPRTQLPRDLVKASEMHSAPSWMKAVAFSLLVSGSGASPSALSRHCSSFLVRGARQQQRQQQASSSSRRSARDRGGLSARSSYLRFLSPWTTRGAVPSRCQELGSGRKWVVEPDDPTSGGTRLRVRPLSTMVMGGVKGAATLASRPVSTTSPTAALRGGGRGVLGGVSAVAAASAASSKRLSSTATAAVAAETADVSIIKPDLDVRSYRYLTLPNGLEVVLINDPFTEQAAASMFIRAGHMQDPAQLAGLAHFHEHSKDSVLIQIDRSSPDSYIV